MQILISAVSSSRQPSGICRHAANLARCLAARSEVSRVDLLVGKWQVRYFTSAFGLCNPKLRIADVDVDYGPFARNIWYIRRLPSVIKACAPDIVHFSFPAPFLPGSLGGPVVTSLHDLYPYDIPENFGFSRVIFNRLFLRQCLRNSTSVVCNSEFTLNRLQSFAPKVARTKAVRIYQSVEFDGINSRKPAAPELKGRPFLLSVAQHRRNKNLELLLTGYAELLRRGGQWEEMALVIVGANGPETAHLEQVVRQLSLQGRVFFLAAVTDSELCWLYRNCALLIAPSSVEGFGLPVVEALQCGARVVCSDIPTFREIAGTAARYFNLLSSWPAKALADAAIASFQARQEQADTLDRFSPKLIAEQYVSLYSQMLANHRPCADQIEPITLDQVMGL